MTRQFLTSPGEKTVCADRDDRGGVLLTTETEEQLHLSAEMLARLAAWMIEHKLRDLHREAAAIRRNAP